MDPKPDKQPVLLAVLAHPDDESFGMGGTLAFYGQRGVAVHLVCATRGEVGEIDPEFMRGFDSAADRRMSELRCAAAILGLSGVHFLDYRDSGMSGSPENQHPRALATAPIDEIAERVTHYIRELRPQVVVTFDPNGGYKHPDHIAIHEATVKAFNMAGDPDFAGDLPPYSPQKLYYSVFPKGWLRFAAQILPLFRQDPRHLGRNGDIDLVDLVEEGDIPVHARIDCRSVEELKDSASACHVSQLNGGMPRRGLINRLMRYMGRKESYMRAYPPAEPGLHEEDLFEGLEGIKQPDLL